MKELKLFIGFIVVVHRISMGSPDDLDDRWQSLCDEPWFENCRNIGVLWKCQKFYQCVETWRNDSGDYNDYFLHQLNATVDEVFDSNGSLNIKYLPMIELNVIKIDTAIHSAPNPFVSQPDIDKIDDDE